MVLTIYTIYYNKIKVIITGFTMNDKLNALRVAAIIVGVLLAGSQVILAEPPPGKGSPFDAIWEAVNDLITRVTTLEENYLDLLERVTILEGGGTVECSPGTADCDGDPSNGCEHVYLDPVAGCGSGVPLEIMGDVIATIVLSDNSEVTYNILLNESPELPGPVVEPTDLELRCTLTCTDSLYSLTLYDGDCNLLYENADQVSYVVLDEMGVANSAELTLKVIYESGCPCSPWALTINTGPDI
jgi:hypothetical protein